ncbi:Carboxylic ester hydrolase [Fusarium keratoplasticum]|uniref:Carboxylic ester hydrolase n=1 Tax=Fusarium keratoplasticum TaxID=1328300 RepID=A0ACC0QRX8_9HYPO|nr:Carboxylic ester hydrolase [Fusarium keratoplasticum]KAI8663429.1 Carboxylic ester hydrolase [Fusarium keratoplasticum]
MAPETSSFLQHPVIGHIRVRDGDGVVQCLGLKYASLENRFAEAQIMDYPSEGHLTATRHGPPVIMPHGAVDFEMDLLQQAIPQFDVPLMSDLDGLNLNITLPKDCNEGSIPRLPVLVFVHGGSFTFGSNSYPHYDQSRIVKLSIEMGKPIIAVNFNYRLGIPGFLTSQELSDAGFKPNRGLRDQRVALRWIKKYIAGFGGDPDQITLVGQSAGAASVDFHMQSEEALFSQAILFGGSSVLLQPLEPETAESVYNSTIQALAPDEQSPEGRIESLLSIPVELMLANASKEMIAAGPTIDHDLIPAAATLGDTNDIIESPMSHNRWCKRLFSIDSQFDGSIFDILNLRARQQGITTSFRTHLIKTLGKTEASRVLDHYSIRDDTPDEESLLSIAQAITDVGYYALSVKYAESFPGDSVLGHFNEPNPWDGVHAGRANHILDIAYLFGNYEERYGPQNKLVARSLAEDVLSFVYGVNDLPVFGVEKKVVVYGPGSDGVSRQILRWDDRAVMRDGTVFELAKEAGGLGKLLQALLSFC